MSSRSGKFAGETYRDEGGPTEYDDRHAADRPDEGGSFAGEVDHRRFPSLPTWWWGAARGVLPRGASGREADGDVDHHAGATENHPAAANPAASTAYHPAEEADGGGIASYWDVGLITLLIVAGAILFAIPEPVTSGLGVVLMGLGVIGWLIDRATGADER